MQSSSELPAVPSLATLRDLPALIDRYLEIVDHVLFLHGFDEFACEFRDSGREVKPVSLGSRQASTYAVAYPTEEPSLLARHTDLPEDWLRHYGEHEHPTAVDECLVAV